MSDMNLHFIHLYSNRILSHRFVYLHRVLELPPPIRVRLVLFVTLGCPGPHK